MTQFSTKCFQDVSNGLNNPDGGNLVFEVSARSLTLAYANMKSSETELFLDTYLYKMVSILLNQTPQRIGIVSVQYVDKSLSTAMNIILWNFRGDPERYMTVLTLLLDCNANYFAYAATAQRSLYLELISNFEAAGGFTVLTDLLVVPSGTTSCTSSDPVYWAGFNNYAVMVQALGRLVDRAALARAKCGGKKLVDVEQKLLVVTVPKVISFLTALMQKLNSIQEADMKKESTDAMKRLVDGMSGVFPISATDDSCYARIAHERSLNNPIGKSEENARFNANSAVKQVLAFQQTFQLFLCSHTLKLLRCQSIVLRLFGWEQLQNLVQMAISTRPCAAAYRVCNAGSPVVNGLYEYAGQNANDHLSPIYEKKPQVIATTTDPVPVLTLLRCSIKSSNQKWWFLSEADSESPGTEKDKDYYNRKPTIMHQGQLAANDREPPTSGWVLSHGSPACEPHPTLHRVGAKIPDGVSEDFYFVNKITSWVCRENILKHIFDLSSLHREVIGRNNKLLLLMAEMQLLSTDDVQLMWRSALTTPDSDCMDEIHTLFAQMSVLMPVETFDCLLVRGCYLSELEAELGQFYRSLDGREDGSSSGGAMKVASTNVSSSVSTVPAVKQHAVLAATTHFLSRVVVLLDKYLDPTVLQQLSLQHVRCLFQVVWLVFKYPMLESVKAHHSVKLLLGKCIDPLPSFNSSPSQNTLKHLHHESAHKCMQVRRKQYLAERNELILSIVNECGMTLSRQAAAGIGSGSQTASSPAKESEIGRMIQVLQFLLASHVSPEIVEILSCQEFPQVLLDETVRFVSVHSHLRESGLQPSSSCSSLDMSATSVSTGIRGVSSTSSSGDAAYVAGLSDRILLIRRFFSICPHINVPRQTVEQLWQLLNGNRSSGSLSRFPKAVATDGPNSKQKIVQSERNILFSFLAQFVPRHSTDNSSAGAGMSPLASNTTVPSTFCSTQDTDEPASPVVTCNRSDSLYIYTAMLCNPKLDWAECGKDGFDCFKAYFDYFSGSDADADSHLLTGMSGFQELQKLTSDTTTERAGGTASCSNEVVSVAGMGLAALWRVFFHINCEESARQAMLLLLQTYNQPESLSDAWKLAKESSCRGEGEVAVTVMESEVEIEVDTEECSQSTLLKKLFAQLDRISSAHKPSTSTSTDTGTTSIREWTKGDCVCLRRCVAALQYAMANSTQGTVVPSRSSSSPHSISAGVTAAVKTAVQFQSLSHLGSSKAHVVRGCMSQIRLSVRFRRTFASPVLYTALYSNHASGDNCINHEINFAMKKRIVKGSQRSLTLRCMHPLNTLHDLKVQVGQAMQCTEYHRMLIVKSGDQTFALLSPILYGDGITLQALGITEGTALSVVFLVDEPAVPPFSISNNSFRGISSFRTYAPIIYGPPTVPEEDYTTSVADKAALNNRQLMEMNTMYSHFHELGSAVVNNSEYFNCLLSLQSRLLVASTADVSSSETIFDGCGSVLSSMWRLLMCMPTNGAVIDSILNAVGIHTRAFGANEGCDSLSSETVEDGIPSMSSHAENNEYGGVDVDVLQLLEEDPSDYLGNSGCRSGNEKPSVDWERILGCPATDLSSSSSSALFCLYKLQVVDYLLQPAKEQFPRPFGAGERKSAPSRYLAALFQIRFIETGGFDYLLRTFTAGAIGSVAATSSSSSFGALTVTASALESSSVSVHDVQFQCHKLSLEVILHIIRTLLPAAVTTASREQASRGSVSSTGSNDTDESSDDSSGTCSEEDENMAAIISSCVDEKNRVQSIYMISRIQDSTNVVGHDTTIVTRLLELASVAASSSGSDGHDGVVNDSLALLTYLLDLKNVTDHLTSNDASKALLGLVFKSQCKHIRGLVSAFTTRLGKSSSSSVVFGWLLWIVESLTDADEHCVPELFAALKSLLVENSSGDMDTNANVGSNSDRCDLARMISNRLRLLVSSNQDHCPGSVTNIDRISECNQEILLGYFQLLHGLIMVDAPAVQVAPFISGSKLVMLLLTEFLFPIPSRANGDADSFSVSVQARPLCRTIETRQAAFSVLLSYINSQHSVQREELVDLVMREVNLLLHCGNSDSDSLVHSIQHEWGMELSADMKTSFSVPTLQQYSADAAVVVFTGLKNQGCTCYLNSLIQQLFMNVNFREAVLRTPILDEHRTRVWHKSNEELIGMTVQIECMQRSTSAGSDGDLMSVWRTARIVEYLATQDCHVVEFISADAQRQGVVVDETAIFNVHEGRQGIETGRVKIISSTSASNDSSGIGGAPHVAPLTPQEAASYLVLEELQRLFMFLLHSQRRYFDPKPFVLACTSLNLTFNVFQQNDASEFCDQLLDRLETAMKGTHTGADIWNKVVLKSVFGGKTMTQKLPLAKQCPAFDGVNGGNKAQCGQWNGSREEDFINIELIIRGKESIDDSFSDMIRGELFDGDNKLTCDTCGEKKAVNRRQVLSTLPNTLILHLKRFDLDFTTFETVKLNNRIAFDMKMNLMQYTHEGLDVETAGVVDVHQHQQKKKVNAKDSGDEDEVDEDEAGPGKGASADAMDTEEASHVTTPPPAGAAATAVALDPAAFDYELQGILVHMGTTQGGHYYSFIRTPDSPSAAADQEGALSGDAADAKWFRFDDDEVTLFNPEHIPIQCFGGPLETTANATHYAAMSGMEENKRTSNALMLFYTKRSSSSTVALVKEVIAQLHGGTTRDVHAVGAPRSMADGYKAFGAEVWAANRRDLFLSYVLDQNLHLFIKDLMNSSVTGATDVEEEAKIAVQTAEHSKDSGSEGAGSGSALAMFQFGCNLLFNVILHSKERTELQLWIDSLNHLVTVTAPAIPGNMAAAEWFLGRVLDSSSCSWMEDYLLDSSDALARSSFVQVLSQCMLSLAPSLVPTLPFGENPTLIGELTRMIALQRDRLSSLVKNRNMNAMVVMVVLSMSEYLISAASHQFKGASEIISLIRNIAEAPVYGELLMTCRFVPKLMMLVHPEKCDASITELFKNVQMTAKSKQELYMLRRDVLETIAAILGAPQIRKVALLEDQIVDRDTVGETSGGGVAGADIMNKNLSIMSLRRSWDPELSTPIKEALTTIFFEVCSLSSQYNSHIHNTLGMDIHDFMMYMDKVTGGVGGGRPTHAQIRQMFDRYDTTSDGKLTLTGFLSYHHSMALRNPLSVWKDIHAFGFENDLTRESTTITHSSINETTRNLQRYHRQMQQQEECSSTCGDDVQQQSPGRHNQTQSQSQLGRTPFSPLNNETKLLLSDLTFYEMGLEAAELATLAIARCVSVRHPDVSVLLIRTACQRIYQLTSSCEGPLQITVLFNFLNHLVLALDSVNSMNYLETRLEALFFGEFGFMTICAEERESPNRRCECNRYDQDMLGRRYFEFTKSFLESVVFMDLYMKNKIDQWMQQRQLFMELERLRRRARAQSKADTMATAEGQTQQSGNGGEERGCDSEDDDDVEAAQIAYVNAVRAIYSDICRERLREVANTTPPHLSMPLPTARALPPLDLNSSSIDTGGVIGIDGVVNTMGNRERGRFNDCMRTDDDDATVAADASFDMDVGVGSIGDNAADDTSLNAQANHFFSSFNIYVDGAGVTEVNGVYQFYQIMDNVTSFVKYGEDLSDRYCIYRCSMAESKDHRWFISMPPKGKLPGTREDIDYYDAEDMSNHVSATGGEKSRLDISALYDNYMPPRNNWTCCARDAEPAPYIMYVTSLNSSAVNSVANTPGREKFNSSNVSTPSFSGRNSTGSGAGAMQGISAYHYSPISPVPGLPTDARRPPLSGGGNSTPGSHTRPLSRPRPQSAPRSRSRVHPRSNPLPLNMSMDLTDDDDDDISADNYHSDSDSDDFLARVGARNMGLGMNRHTGGSIYSDHSPQLTEEVIESNVRMNNLETPSPPAHSCSETDELTGKESSNDGYDSDGGSSVAVNIAPDSDFED